MKTLISLFGLVLLLPNPVSAEPLETWTVAGLRADDEAPLHDDLTALRGALSLELTARGRGSLIESERVRLRWGAEADLPSIREHLDTAELYYFQLELEAARRYLEQALDELPTASGRPEAWEWTRDARMLLAMVHLAAGDEQAQERAEAEFAAITRVDPAWRPPDTAWPPQALELYARVRGAEQVRQAGRLRVPCSPDCAGGGVFADARLIGAPAQVIALPPGRYRGAVGDRFERPTKRSLLREIEIRAGKETTLSVDLEAESDLATPDGLAVLAPIDADLRDARAALAARHAGTDNLLLLHRDREGHLLAWGLDGRARLRGTFETEGEGEEALSSLAAQVVRAYLERPEPPAEPEEPPAFVAADAPAPGGAPPALQAMRWGTLGAALVASGVGTWQHVDAAQRDQALGSRLDGWSGAVPDERSAAAARTEADAIVTQQAWGTGLLIGGGTLGATALLLFLIDGADEPAPTIRW